MKYVRNTQDTIVDSEVAVSCCSLTAIFIFIALNLSVTVLILAALYKFLTS